MARPSFLSPGSIVRVTGGAGLPEERDCTGFVRRTAPINGDDVKVTLLDGTLAGATLSYRNASLSPVT